MKDFTPHLLSEVSRLNPNKRIFKSLRMLDEHTVEMAFEDEVLIELEDIKNAFKQVNEFTGERRLKKLIIAGRKTEITRDARNFGHTESLRNKDNVVAEAIVVHLLYHKMITNFYIRFIRDSYPTRFFTDVEKAREWLNSIEDR